jgi:hypothetical protein
MHQITGSGSLGAIRKLQIAQKAAKLRSLGFATFVRADFSSLCRLSFKRALLLIHKALTCLEKQQQPQILGGTRWLGASTI